MADNENIEVNPTIELEDEVDMGSVASEYNAEAWAVGERHGVPVGESDQTYHNNAKYYAGKGREDAEAWAIGQRNGSDVPYTDPTYHNNAKWYAEHVEQNVEAQVLRAEAARDEAVAAVEDFGSGLSFKGSVNYASGLPASPALGDEYLVLYSGSAGTNYIGQKYAWDGTVWRPIGNDLRLYRDADGDLCEED